MSKLLQPIFYALIALAILTSCNDAPTSIPNGMSPKGDQAEPDKFDSQQSNLEQESSNFVKLENLYGADKRLIGSNSYAKSSILYSWSIYLPDSILSLIKTGDVTVDTALVTMVISYHLGTTQPVYFTAQQLTGDWPVVTLKRDSLQYFTDDSQPNIITSDITYSNDSTASFQLDKNVVNQWLMFEADSNLTNTNYGIILKPKAGSPGFIGFNSTYYYDSSVPQTTLSVTLKKNDVPYDTVVAYPYKDLHVVEGIGTVPLGSEDKIILEGGYALRGKLYMKMPDLQPDVSIIKAMLELTVDEANTIDGDPSSDSIYVHMYKNSVQDSLVNDSTSAYAYTLLVRSGNKFTGDISRIVQRWVRGDNPNEGVRLTLYDEYSSVAKIVLYGSKESNPEYRPRLTIDYARKL